MRLELTLHFWVWLLYTIDHVPSIPSKLSNLRHLKAQRHAASTQSHGYQQSQRGIFHLEVFLSLLVAQLSAFVIHV
ncbi:hypothetical protein HDK77DRAFT_433323 [Phyllosticta capitalensis]